MEEEVKEEVEVGWSKSGGGGGEEWSKSKGRGG